MPIYEYRCTACGHQFEVIQKISEAAPDKCPECHKSKLEKMVSAAGFQLKGSGWYVTDFKNSGQKKQEQKQDQPAEKSKADKAKDGAASDKSPSKPAKDKKE